MYVYHIHWEPYVREEFVVLHEADNENDRHTMAVYCIHESPGVIEAICSKKYQESHITLQDMKER